ncbi:MAG: ABC-three component system middle component 6 [Flavobacteriales bacterium]
MILPTKHIMPERALITIASEIGEVIGPRSTISSIWNDFQYQRKKQKLDEIPFDWFVLSVDLLFLMGIIEEQEGYIKKILR